VFVVCFCVVLGVVWLCVGGWVVCVFGVGGFVVVCVCVCGVCVCVCEFFWMKCGDAKFSYYFALCRRIIQFLLCVLTGVQLGT